MTATTVYTGVPARGARAKLRALGPPAAVVAGLGVCCAVVWIGDPTTPGGFLPVCPTKALFGIDCPGCGGMRMAYSLMHGDIPAALHYNAVSFVVVLLFGWSTAAWTLGRLRGRAMNSWLHWRWTPLVFAVVFVVWFVIRNLPFAPFTGLRV
ncbi:DUF2752 domain-containing protein [Amycolatopsis australiensis]|uniref:DUF2752 domain-containing protein n=1 Tax=Amycolatopsis australiensis TaxID=546364 RepID=A0A1K1RRE7_9PSEU|nr:DUF2752 domain-containing protein [Amycolatopsis australiensis]SFW74319.1 Protein of unknown function [Amycolatopsis australiensis]